MLIIDLEVVSPAPAAYLHRAENSAGVSAAPMGICRLSLSGPTPEAASPISILSKGLLAGAKQISRSLSFFF